MVAKTDIRQTGRSQPPKVAAIPSGTACGEEARAAAEQDPVLAAFLYSTVSTIVRWKNASFYRICERLDHPDMQAVLLRQTFEEMLDGLAGMGRYPARRYSGRLRPRSRPACASWSRCSISRAFTPSRRTGWRTGC